MPTTRGLASDATAAMVDVRRRWARRCGPRDWRARLKRLSFRLRALLVTSELATRAESRNARRAVRAAADLALHGFLTASALPALAQAARSVFRRRADPCTA